MNVCKQKMCVHIQLCSVSAGLNVPYIVLFLTPQRAGKSEYQLPKSN